MQILLVALITWGRRETMTRLVERSIMCAIRYDWFRWPVNLLTVLQDGQFAALKRHMDVSWVLTNKNVIRNSRVSKFLNFFKKDLDNRLILIFIKVPYQNSLEDDELEVVNGYNKNIVDNQHYFWAKLLLKLCYKSSTSWSATNYL